jgi:hypothetical protein
MLAVVAVEFKSIVPVEVLIATQRYAVTPAASEALYVERTLKALSRT